ncbi:MAG: hypothetical protein AAGF66_08790 [Cyanobacteria bacterium P01_H01_bin.119]
MIAALVIIAVFFTAGHSFLWPGGFGFQPRDTITEVREIEENGEQVRTTKTTVPGKTLWDWLSLLGAPVSIAILGFWLQSLQKQREKATQAEEARKRQDEKEREILRIEAELS